MHRLGVESSCAAIGGDLMATAGKPTYIPIHYQPFMADDKVLAMDGEQVGAYFLLIIVAWQGIPPCSFVNDPDKIAKWARVKPARWEKISPDVMACFRLEDGRWYHDRLAQEYSKSLKRMEIARNNGKVGGRPKNNPAGYQKEPSGLSENNPAGSDPVSGGLTNRDYEIKRLRDSKTKPSSSPTPPNVAAQIPRHDDHEETSFVIREIRKATGRTIGANDRYKMSECQTEIESMDPPVIGGEARTWAEVYAAAVAFSLKSSSNHAPVPLARHAMSVAITCRTTNQWPGVAVTPPTAKKKTVWDEIDKEPK